MLNVVGDFAADPTGAADAATAIQNAINTAKAVGGVVFFPSGSYKIASTISLYNGVWLIGEIPKQTTSGGTVGVKLNYTGATEMFKSAEQLSELSGGFGMENLTLTMEGSAQSTGTVRFAFFRKGCRRAIFRNLILAASGPTSDGLVFPGTDPDTAGSVHANGNAFYNVITDYSGAQGTGIGLDFAGNVSTTSTANVSSGNLVIGGRFDGFTTAFRVSNGNGNVFCGLIINTASTAFKFLGASTWRNVLVAVYVDSTVGTVVNADATGLSTNQSMFTALYCENVHPSKITATSSPKYYIFGASSGGASSTEDDEIVYQSALRVVLGSTEQWRWDSNGALVTTGVLSAAIGTGTGTGKVHSVPSVNTASVSNTTGSGTEDDLMTYSLPANSLSATNKGVRVTAWGSTANNTNTKAVRLYFGSTLVATTTPQTFDLTDWKLVGEVYKTGANAQAYHGLAIIARGDSQADVRNRRSTGSETDTTAITIKVTGQGVAASDVTQYFMQVEFIN